MSVAGHDENARPTIICASNADGLTIVPALATPAHRLQIDDGTTGANNGNNNGNAVEDENSVAVWTVLSSVGDGSVIEVYADSVTKRVLINSH